MKKEICIVFISLISSLAVAQNSQVTIGSTTVIEEFYQVKYDPSDGSTVSVGYLNNPSTATGNDCFIAKLNALQQIVWQKTISNTGDDAFYQVIVCSNGDYVVAGKLTQSGKIRGYVCRITSATGNIIWSSSSVQTNSQYGDLFYDVFETASHNIALAGTTNYQPGLTNGLVVLMNSGGAPLWSKVSNFSASDEFQSINQLPNNNLLVAGFYNTGSSYSDALLELDENSGVVLSESTYTVNTTVPGNSTLLNSIWPVICSAKNGTVYFYLWVFNGISNTSNYISVNAYDPVTKNLNGNIYYHQGSPTSGTFNFHPIDTNDFLLAESYASPGSVFVSRVTNGSVIYDRKVVSPVKNIYSLNVLNNNVVFTGCVNNNPNLDAYYLFSTTDVPASTTPCTITNSNTLNLLANNLTGTAGSPIILGNIAAMSSISTSTISTAYSLNLICGCTNATINLQPADVTLCGSGNASFNVSALNASSYQWQLNTGSGWNDIINNATYSGATTTTLFVTGVTLSMNNYQYRCIISNSCSNITSTAATLTVLTPLVTSVGITASPNTAICSGTAVQFTAVPTNGGATPAYQWQVNGINVGTSSPTYTTNSLVNGDAVQVIMTSNLSCATGSPANSNSISMAVTQSVTPLLNIVASSTTICSGTSVTFTATPTNGGTTPGYQWQINGANVGTNSPVYTSSTLNNGDLVKCILTSNYICSTSPTATSNTITMTVNAAVIPSVSIAASANNICIGTFVTFTATPVNGGTSPSYQWKANGVNVGTNSPTYSTNSIANGDVISCILTNLNSCSSTTTANSNNIAMIVKTTVVPSITISSDLNDICPTTPVTFTAMPLNVGTSSSFQWKLNGNNVGGNSQTYVNSNLANGDKVNCVMNTVTTCSNTPFVYSDTITMIVKTIPLISFNPPNPTIAFGSFVQLNATVTGNASSYFWTPAAGLSNPTILNPIASPAVTTVYNLGVIASNGCFAEKSLTVTVFNSIVIPNSFTPNGDTRNDIFRIPPGTSLKLDYFIIYDRYGNEIFRTSDIGKGWDGTFKGTKSPAGAYVYIIRGNDSKGAVFLYGSILVIR